MKKTEINTLLRQYAREHLSPTPEERKLVTDIYAAIGSVLGAERCIQIGSYPRLTAVTPLHDLDVLYVLGIWNPAAHDPSVMLRQLHTRLRGSFRNPTHWSVRFRLQTHSVLIVFQDGHGNEKLSVDIVPAFIEGQNEFRQHTYVVPEIVRQGHAAREIRYRQLAEQHREMGWIRSDPRGYIEVSKRIDTRNQDFRKSVKIAKGWNYSCKALFNSELKSFHIEQLISERFVAATSTDIFEAVFSFFVDLPANINKARIPDRADPNRLIDEYVNELGLPEKRNIIEARDCFLKKLEDLQDNPNVKQLLTACQHERKGRTEQYLFDQGIPVLTQYPISIEATALQGNGWRQSILDRVGLIKRDRKIQFRVRPNANPVDTYKWKVKNDDASRQPRGEITNNRTLNDPENTKYDGTHYVECYAIKDGVCVARARQNVTLDRDWS